MKLIRPSVVSLSLAIVCTVAAPAADLFVSPTGNDTDSGDQASPVASLARAKELARRFAGTQPVTVHVADGVYELPETLVFDPADSGTADHPMVYAAENDGGAVLSGGTTLSLQWKRYRDGILMAETPDNLVIDQLFVNGQNQRMARYPNYDARKTTEAYQGFAADAFSKERAARWNNPIGGFIHAMHRSRWGGYHYRITGKDASGEVTYEGGWQNNRQMGMHKDYRMVENIFEELDAPGEWYHDAENKTLYYLPGEGTDMRKANAQVVRLRHLIEFQGAEATPVRFITLKGFVVRHAARTFMETKEPMLRSDWAIYRGGAFVLSGTEDAKILDTEFDQVGGNAIFVNDYNRRVLVRGCHIHDTGASGICFVGDPEAVRDPLFQYSQKNDLSKIDRTPGPRSNNYPADSMVEDCLIHGIGRVERQPAGVQIEMARRITVRDCSIYDCARAGINIGDGAWGGHLIERCDVFDTVQETHDHGSFNSWGRDRYWRSDHLTASQVAVDEDPTLPFLDAVETTVIRDSRWRCDHGWDIDLDDGSSNYDLYNNLMLSGGLKFREGFRRRAWNNITVNNGFHPHVWFNNSQDEVFGNLFMAAHRGARMPSEIAKGKRVDGNLFYAEDPAMKDRHADVRWDLNSIVADPMFVDPAAGDFRVRDGSPAFKIGFKNFPMDQFGVKKASLRVIAKTPVIPELEVQTSSTDSPSRRPVDSGPLPNYWLGAKLTDLKGGEFSAFGVSEEEGGIVLAEVAPDSDAAKAGLSAGDLIQSLQGRKVKRVADLMEVYREAADSSLELDVVRNQQPLTRVVANGAYLTTESASTPSGFSILVPPDRPFGKVEAKPGTQNATLKELVDGKLSDGYGPVFANGVSSGAYRIDLGESRDVTAITSWTANKNGNRGVQRLTLYGSHADTDPGWRFEDRSKFVPLGTIDTTRLKSSPFNAASLRSRAGGRLGRFRWVAWRVAPVTGRGENSAFQELQVE